jgi:hypothetical protein
MPCQFSPKIRKRNAWDRTELEYDHCTKSSRQKQYQESRGRGEKEKDDCPSAQSDPYSSGEERGRSGCQEKEICQVKFLPVRRLPIGKLKYEIKLVYRLANNDDVAGGQLAVFQGASEAPISVSYGSSEQRGKTANWPPARRVALKMGRRPRCSSVTYRFRYALSSRLADGPF